MRIYFLSIAILLSSFAPVQYINPTGTYKLVSKTRKVKDDVYGYMGSIQIKKLAPNRIVVTLGVNKGAPSYNMGTIIDTLEYKNNSATHTNPEFDSTCKITFTFTKKGISVKEETADYNWGCGFGHAVVADGFYKKISSKTPILIHPATGEKIGY